MIKEKYNLFWLFTDKAIRSSGTLFLTIFLGRVYGPEAFGVFVLSYSLVFLFSLVSQLGMKNYIINKIITEKEFANIYLMSGFLSSLGASVIFTIIYLLSMSNIIIGNEDYFYIPLVFSLLIPLKSFEVLSYWLEAKVISKYHVWAINIAFIFSAPLKFGIIINDLPLEYYALVILLEYMLFIAILYYISYSMMRFMTKKSLSISHIIEIIKESLPLLLTSMTVSLAMRLDQIMIAKIINTKQTGIYAAGVQLAEMQNIISVIVVQTFLPRILKQK